MLYFSELHNKKIYNKEKIEIGRLKDLIFLATDNPLVTKIVIENKNKNKEIIPSSYIVKINDKIIIEDDYLPGYLEENEIYLIKNLLDKQIIDIEGNKIVRVNDVVLVKNNNKLYVSGVDIGFIGILRRLRIFKVEKIYNFLGRFNIRFTSDFLPWVNIHPLELSRGQVKLKKTKNKLEKLRPEDLAGYIEKTNLINTKKILEILDIDKAAEVVSNLNINYQSSLFRSFRPETAAKFLRYIDPDEAVDVFLTLPKKKQNLILEKLDKKTKINILKLEKLSKDPIGSLMTIEYLAVSPENSVRQVIEKIKKEARDFSFLDYIYVINKKSELVGVFSLYEMLMEEFDTPVYKFMIQNIIVVHLTTPIDIVIKKMFRYKIYALPVIDETKKILGIITLDDLSSYILDKLF